MKYTPMIEQYLKIKEKHKDCFLFYRLGDFYELFFEDAVEASKLLEITLTGREAGVEERIPMCGVPYHSAATYIDTLVNLGNKVAICEQVTPAEQGKIVERKVVRIITPGTYMHYKNLDENNYLGAVYKKNNIFYFSFVDIMTGDARAIKLQSMTELLEEVYKNNIKEILNIQNSISDIKDIYVTNVELKEDITYPNTINLIDTTLRLTCDNLLNYIEYTQNIDLKSIKNFEVYLLNEYVYMTNYSLKNLEISRNIATLSKKGSLLSVIDKTKTSAGARKIKKWVENPLLNTEKILTRQNIVSDFKDEYFVRMELQNILRDVYDIERVSTKLAYNIVSPRELLNLKNTIDKLPAIKELLSSIRTQNIDKLNSDIDTLEDLKKYLNNAIHEKAGHTVKDGNVIREGFNEELDRYRSANVNAGQMLLNIEMREKEKTNIKNLKIGHNKIFGYYIEISKTNLKNIDTDSLGYIRKQTLSNCERYITEELKEIENYIVNSSSKIEELELELFQEVKNEIRKYIIQLQQLADCLSDIDVYISLANIAEEYNYTKPIFNDKNVIDIKGGRHPIVERMVKDTNYVKNDCEFSAADNILLITGPNMSGKSTFMRQVALIVILAQMGSYVPCSQANLPIFDKIFTRIGASDDLAGGKSTFMVEMIEAKNALVESTENSLLIFDEIGRGTSTYDGIALAQSILEYINKEIKCKTLFSTHYHELTKLESIEKGIKNIHVSAKEDKGELTFLYKVQGGAIEKSYGIHVAKLADLPKEVINNANKILEQLESGQQEVVNQEHIINTSKANKDFEKLVFDLEDDNSKLSEVEEYINKIDLFNTTPLQAMNILNELKNKFGR